MDQEEIEVRFLPPQAHDELFARDDVGVLVLGQFGFAMSPEVRTVFTQHIKGNGDGQGPQNPDDPQYDVEKVFAASPSIESHAKILTTLGRLETLLGSSPHRSLLATMQQVVSGMRAKLIENAQAGASKAREEILRKMDLHLTALESETLDDAKIAKLQKEYDGLEKRRTQSRRKRLS